MEIQNLWVRRATLQAQISAIGERESVSVQEDGTFSFGQDYQSALEWQKLNDELSEVIKKLSKTSVIRGKKMTDQEEDLPIPYSGKVLKECIDIMARKSRDYQNPNSRVRQADYYPRGIDSLMDIIHTKYLRTVSVLEGMKETASQPQFESVEDSLKDMINYAAFGVAWCRGMIDGQDPDSGLFNDRRVNPQRQGIDAIDDEIFNKFGVEPKDAEANEDANIHKFIDQAFKAQRARARLTKEKSEFDGSSDGIHAYEFLAPEDIDYSPKLADSQVVDGTVEGAGTLIDPPADYEIPVAPLESPKPPPDQTPVPMLSEIADPANEDDEPKDKYADEPLLKEVDRVFGGTEEVIKSILEEDDAND